MTDLIGTFKNVPPSCFDCRSFKALISEHFRRMQACLFLPGPPNFIMSKQYLHCPQSSLVHAEQLPQRPRFLSPIVMLVLYLSYLFTLIPGFGIGHFSCLIIHSFVTSL